ncbi:MAG: N-acyl homoserine lactonase family protein [Peptococcaceae bacterium]|jgi:glyoxylase-like metal-dependent hydrolase (beta-lactamase superfamily II)|nr:N-acyl homoserine lactonase family protein [Peptococcaceae bacterium]MDH7524869.1 N-acyl homoserine lactonase family protein [Peptococcaceae bacterium]
MRKYSIRPIPLCEGERDMSQWTYRWNMGKKTKTACFIWYLEGSDPVTLVDAGAQAEHFTNPEFPMKTRVTLEDGLKRFGLAPEDVKQVILTHLHFDHVALAKRFSSAVFIVQRKELEFARNPHVFCAVDYNPAYFEGLNMRLVDGDVQIMPGVKALFTPGHSPGGQSVQVETGSGRAIIAGLCTQMITFEQTPFMKERGLEVAACGLHTDCREAYDSALRIKREAEVIVALHDPVFIETEKIG